MSDLLNKNKYNQFLKKLKFLKVYPKTILFWGFEGRAEYASLSHKSKPRAKFLPTIHLIVASPLPFGSVSHPDSRGCGIRQNRDFREPEVSVGKTRPATVYVCMQS
jgi:hypothetical protein